MTAVPLAGWVIPVTAKASLFGSMSFANTLIATGIPFTVAAESAMATGGQLIMTLENWTSSTHQRRPVVVKPPSRASRNRALTVAPASALRSTSTWVMVGTDEFRPVQAG